MYDGVSYKQCMSQYVFHSIVGDKCFYQTGLYIDINKTSYVIISNWRIRNRIY